MCETCDDFDIYGEVYSLSDWEYMTSQNLIIEDDGSAYYCVYGQKTTISAFREEPPEYCDSVIFYGK